MTWGNSSSSYNYNSSDRDVKMSIEFYKQKNLKRTTEISFRDNIDYQNFLDRVEGKYKGLSKIACILERIEHINSVIIGSPFNPFRHQNHYIVRNCINF